MSGERGPAPLRVVAATACTLLGLLAAPVTAAATDTTTRTATAIATATVAGGGIALATTSDAAYGTTSDVTASATHGAISDASAGAAPGLTLAVLGGGSPTDERTAVDYTIELRNDGSLPYRHLAVSALLPAGFHLLHASPEPASARGVPTWTADLAPGQRLAIHVRVAAGTLQDLADGDPAPLAEAPTALVDASAPGAQAWYSVSACVRRSPGDPPAACGLSSQLLVKTDDDTRSGVTAIVLLLGLPAVAALLGAYAWRARRDPGDW